MTYLKILLLILMCLALFGFSGCAAKLYETEGGYKRGREFYSTDAAKRQAAADTGEIMWLTCSYYGRKFHGRPTANGEIFDMYKLSCAHKAMAFGTVLKITNPDNGKSVTLRVNDRGPFVNGRDIDLSYGAARELDMLEEGVKVLQVEILETP